MSTLRDVTILALWAYVIADLAMHMSRAMGVQP